ncbi:MAG: hypothetical protein COZ57_30225, partial [Armatimonadetes bacterium CG_4_8_14_3_um_filter_66_20]
REYKAAEAAFASTLTKTAMPTDLFVQVTGLTDGWTAAKQVNGGPLEAITVHGGAGYTNLDLNPADVAVVVGHPVTCSNPAVRLVVWWTESGLEVYAQNPTNAAITCTLHASDAFKGLPAGEKTVTLAAGGVASVSWQ